MAQVQTLWPHAWLRWACSMAADGRGGQDAVATFSATPMHGVCGDDGAMTCRIAFVLFPGFQQLDLAGPMAVFEVARLAQPARCCYES